MILRRWLLVGAGLGILALVQGRLPVDTSKSAVTGAAPASAEKVPDVAVKAQPAADPPPVTLTPYRVAMLTLDRAAFPDVQVKGSSVTVSYRLDGEMFSVAHARRAFDRYAAEIVPAMFEHFAKIDTVSIDADASTIDIRGNEGRGLAAAVTFTRRNATRIRWDRIDQANLEKLADRAWYGAKFKDQ